MNKIIIESKINPDNNNHEYRARLDANYNLTVSPELVENTQYELRSIVESELKNGMSDIVYGDIKKEVHKIIEVWNNLCRVRGYEYTDDDILKEQMTNLEEITNNISNLCVFH